MARPRTTKSTKFPPPPRIKLSFWALVLSGCKLNLPPSRIFHNFQAFSCWIFFVLQMHRWKKFSSTWTGGLLWWRVGGGGKCRFSFQLRLREGDLLFCRWVSSLKSPTCPNDLMMRGCNLVFVVLPLQKYSPRETFSSALSPSSPAPSSNSPKADQVTALLGVAF